MTVWIDYRGNRSFRRTRTDYPLLAEHCKYVLSDEERAFILEQAIAVAANPYQRAERERFISIGTAVSSSAVLKTCRETLGRLLEIGEGVALLDNLPGDPMLPPTPERGGSLEAGYKATFVSEFVLVLIGGLIGADVFNFRQEGSGKAPLFDNVVPIVHLTQQKGAGGYSNNFPFHSESAWHRKRPDYIALVGIRSDPKALTLVATADAVKDSGLPDSMPAGAFRLKPPDLYVQMQRTGIPLGTPFYRYAPPLTLIPRPGMNVNFNGTDCLGTGALRWLDELEELVESTASSCLLGAGNALILNNSRTCHTRTGYEPDFGPNARWFVRGYFKKDLWVNTAFHDDISDADAEQARKLGWLDDAGVLTHAFGEIAERPMAITELKEPRRSLAERLLPLTPPPGHRIV